jgi:hypothetical protein
VSRLHEAVYGPNHEKAGQHYAWFWWCPGCKDAHACDSRWKLSGDESSPTFDGSILVHADASIGRPQCHSYVRAGKVQYLGDCTHALKGQTVDLPVWRGVDPNNY